MVSSFAGIYIIGEGFFVAFKLIRVLESSLDKNFLFFSRAIKNILVPLWHPASQIFYVRSQPAFKIKTKRFLAALPFIHDGYPHSFGQISLLAQMVKDFF